MKKLMLTKKDFFRIIKESTEEILASKDHLGWDTDEEVMDRLQTSFIDTFGIDNISSPQFDESSFLSFKVRIPSGRVFVVHLDEPYDVRVSKPKNNVLIFDKNLAADYQDFDTNALVADLKDALLMSEKAKSPERVPNFKPRDPFIYVDDSVEEPIFDKKKLNEHKIENFVKKLFQKD